MGFRISLKQPVAVNRRVALRGGEARVAQKFLDHAKIRAAHPEIPMHIYPAGHGFNCDARGSYDAASATLARTRTMEFLAKHLA